MNNNKNIFGSLQEKISVNKLKKIGKVTCKNDKIVCVIDSKKLKKEYTGFSYYIDLSELDKNITSREIEYHFNNILFDKTVYIEANSTSDVYFKNCVFEGSILLNEGNVITFENNMYLKKSNTINVYDNNYLFISVRKKDNINKLRFINDNILSFRQSIVQPYLIANEIELINTKINTNNSMLIKSNNLYLDNSVINTKELYLDSVNVNNNNSTIKTEDAIIELKNINDEFISQINCKNIYYNNKIMSNLVKIENIEEGRMQLINTLRKISNNCDNYIESIKEKVTDNLKDKQPIKILTKVK